MNPVDRAASRLGDAARAAGLGARSFGLVDTNPVPADWRHVTKIDPEAEKRLPLLYPLYLKHTDAVSVGGSRDVDSENTEETFELLAYADVPAFHEPSAPRHVTDRTREMSDFLAIPEVLNGDVDSLVGKLGAGAEYIRETLAPELIERKLPWLPARFVPPLADFATGWLIEDAVFEAYIIQNVDSAAAREAGVGEADLLSPEEAAQRALAAEKRLGSEVVYLEYSGTYGGDEAAAILEAIDETVTWPRIWYGGGLASRADAERVLDAGADAVIVGNAFHEVAEEERRLCVRAAEEVSSSPSVAAVDSWLEDAVDLPDTAAARYLSTIPAVERPAHRARSYLAATVYLDLAIERAIDGLEGDDGPAASESLSELVESDVDGLVADAATRSIVHAYATARLADRSGGSPDPGLPIDHLGLNG